MHAPSENSNPMEAHFPPHDSCEVSGTMQLKPPFVLFYGWMLELFDSLKPDIDVTIHKIHPKIAENAV